jgi:beta-xylosidase
MNIEHLITPYKLGRPVLTGSGKEGTYNLCAVDCPVVFSHGGKFVMMHIGFDGIGYQTALAESDDLVNWRERGVILRRGSNMKWDSVGMAGTAILMEKDLYGGNKLIKWQGKYWIMYHAYPGEGYEAGSHHGTHRSSAVL